jgi:predicted SprT family Zn-dependent metalloprotease
MARKRFRRITIKFDEMRTTWGLAYTDDHLIVLDPRMTDATMAEVAAHEVAHVICPYLEEEAVELLGRHIGDVLMRLGFRRIEEH